MPAPLAWWGPQAKAGTEARLHVSSAEVRDTRKPRQLFSSPPTRHAERRWCQGSGELAGNHWVFIVQRFWKSGVRTAGSAASWQLTGLSLVLILRTSVLLLRNSAIRTFGLSPGIFSPSI